ncbi:hypothetical protein UC34_22300 [Pandoraea vervacti]|uniref:DUF4410 domain-containing protein n=1 Tax=Pandoraea vervacti TaxID=656178 RepID=A0ABM5T246_9BURK|nr:DUF4410 domain-containing protein [Pandoraea vervacti]AJP58931.1 hypothetical protein UC34_22300 [Pandoraea vervacti]
MNVRNFSRSAVVSMILALTGCASTSSGPDSSRGVDPALAATLKQGVALPTIESNGHTIDDEVKSGVIDAFKKQADKNGMLVSANGVPVKITVEEYSTRSAVARVMLGFLAGGDHIKARVDVSGKTYTVEDTARSSINGISLVAENVGSDVANGIATLAGVTVNTIQRQQPPVGMTTR